MPSRPVIFAALAASLVAGCGVRTALTTSFDAGPSAPPRDAAPADAPFCRPVAEIAQPIENAVVPLGYVQVIASRRAQQTHLVVCYDPSCSPESVISRSELMGDRAWFEATTPGVRYALFERRGCRSAVRTFHVAPPQGPAVDLDSDGRADVVVGAPSERRVDVFLSPAGSGVFADRSILGATPGFGRAVAVPGDLDADGHDDLVVADDQGAVLAYRSAPGAAFSGPFFSTPADGGAVELHALGDHDGDGYDDLLVVRAASCTTEVWLGGRVPPRVEVIEGAGGSCSTGAPPVARAVGNIEGVGRGILAVAQPGGTLRVFDALAWSFEARLFEGHPAIDLAAADLDGDGGAEIVVAAYDGLVTGWSTMVPLDVADVGRWGEGGRALAALGDVDGDGRDDVGIASTSGYALHAGVPGRTELFPIGPAVWPAVIAAVGDVDGDGRADVAMRTDTGVTVLGMAPDRSVHTIAELIGDGDFGVSIASAAPR